MALKIGKPPVKIPFDNDSEGVPNRGWTGWILNVQALLETLSQSGTTANRPTKIFTGQFYFDTTLDQPIWVDTAGTGWVDATGASA